MPKRVGFLYEKMCSKDAIRSAFITAAKHKAKRYDVSRIMKRLDFYVDKTYDMLMEGSFVPSKPREKEVCDHSSLKKRTIEIVPFWPDGVVHQLLVTAMQPVLMRGMHYWSCASIPGRGASHAQTVVKRMMRDKNGNYRYYCKMDIRHFYHSIDRDILMTMLRRKIKDERFLSVVRDVIMSCREGLAIGFYVCQWLANFYLEDLDRYIIGLDGVKKSPRYMDDIVMSGPNKKKLHKARKKVDMYLRKKLLLRMKQDWQVFPIKSRALDFVGYKFTKTHVTLRRRNFLRLTRQVRRVNKRTARGESIPFDMAASVLSRMGALTHCDSTYVMKKYFPKELVDKFKEVVSHESKRRNRASEPVYA